MENLRHLRIRNDVSECPDSFKVFEELVRYYYGCGYTEKVTNKLVTFLFVIAQLILKTGRI